MHFLVILVEHIKQLENYDNAEIFQNNSFFSSSKNGPLCNTMDSFYSKYPTKKLQRIFCSKPPHIINIAELIF